MNVELNREKLATAALLASRVTGKNLSLPVLSCLLLVVGDGGFKIRATNLDLGTELAVPAKVKKEGVIAVPAAVFVNTISSIAGESVVLEASETTLTIKTKQGNSTINLLPSNDFPVLPYLKGKASFTMPVGKLTEGIRSVHYAASTSSIKPELGSVYVVKAADSVKFVATDSFRLAERTLAVKTSDFEPILIPARNISDILRILESAEDDVEVRVSESQCAFISGSTYVTSRLIDGSFPDYGQIIPKSKITEVITLKGDFLAALRKAVIFSDKFNQITFTVAPKKSAFVIKARNTEVGESEDTVPATLTGEDIEISFNHRYLLDCFQSVSTDSLSLSLNGPGKPMVIRGVPDSGFLYLIMPMNR
jgi:DNA polymerase-3 subunit beta